jgi:hypothetical protein
MRRRTFDLLVSGAGLVLAVLLLIAGGLLTWTHSFINDQVSTQLSAQKIFFPPANSPAVAGKEFAPMRQYGGQQLTNGAQAQTYANYFIANHLKEVAGGKTYAQVSALAQADQNNAQLQGQVATMFKGETLRGLLLNAYAFWKIGQIALIAAFFAFIGAGLLLLLTLFGFIHARRVKPDVELMAPKTHEPLPV